MHYLYLWGDVRIVLLSSIEDEERAKRWGSRQNTVQGTFDMLFISAKFIDFTIYYSNVVITLCRNTS